MNSHMVIEARDVTLRLGSGDAAVDVLRGLTLDVPAGQRIAILGPSGSGKSSAMAVLSGMERASSGSVRVAGAEFTTMDEDGLARARRGRIGIVLQAFHLIPTMTALENVAVPLELAGETDVQARAKAELEAVGLGHRLHHYPTQLSGGEQQRVAIARALVGRPALIFADEPTGNLDAATGAAIIELLFGRLTETGATLVLITHDADLAPLCDRIITMRDGLIVDDRMNLAQAAE
ncbi:ATP-binding cassette domain-containing protein [Sandarakinorhabdus sp.]|jgi:putative ABC transport system ATP-binding protein|uniref:ABC transporter ATP-binding protein n=1 Tax=Sandarakinorhabdus sp. TaxID=1916663 RepID=UPI0028AA2D68|nr:ATP-binding cassette domain-containing protein [Sandarakinorhabdus sp.]